MADKILALITAFFLGVGAAWFLAGRCMALALRHAPSIRAKFKDFIQRVEETSPTLPGAEHYATGPYKIVVGSDPVQPMFTQEEVLIVLRNLGHDVECGACMAIAFTGLGLPGDEHTCKGRQPLPSSVPWPGAKP